jgi:hypothetical protein
MFWEYDTRLGRRWNVDPIVKVWESGYATFFNSPISIIDPLGLTGEKTASSPGCMEGKIKEATVNLSDEQRAARNLKKALKAAVNSKAAENLYISASTNYAEYSNEKSGGKLDDFVPDKEVTPDHLGYQWVMGTGSDKRVFDQNSVMGKQMLKTPEVSNAINMVVEKVVGYVNFNTQDFSRELLKEGAFSYMLSFVEDMQKNPARAFHGSFSGSVQVQSVLFNPNTNSIMVNMYINIADNMTAPSGTRLPPKLGGYSNPPLAIFPYENPFGKSGQFRTINIKYKMFHTVNIPLK